MGAVNRFNPSAARAAFALACKKVPAKLGSKAVEWFDNSFKNQGFANHTLLPWRRTKSGKKNEFGKRSSGILIRSGRLRRGTRVVLTTPAFVLIANAVPYAKAHNEGGKSEVPVKQHERRLKAYTYTLKGRQAQKKAGRKSKTTVRAHTRRRNLPRRQFMGKSAMLNREFRKIIIQTINEAIRAGKGG